jgi:hypothetical protein
MKLYLECNPDEVLARVVGVPRRAIVHSHGKGRVSKHLDRQSGVSGLVDEDPGSAQPRTLAGFVEVSSTHDVRLKIDKNRNNRLVVLCPELEDWVIKTAKSARVKMEEYSLSERPGELHANINQRLSNLERLLKELAALKSPRLLHLQSLLVGI